MSRPTASSQQKQSIEQFVKALAAKQPTPGGGAAAAIGAAIGGAAASMSAAYTSRKKDVDSGNAQKASILISKLNLDAFLKAADDDAEAYANLQRTWKKPDDPDAITDPIEREAVEKRALEVPTKLVESCHEGVVEIRRFLPYCNSNITSDAKVGIHQLGGAARAAFQTVLVNRPSNSERERLTKLLDEIRAIEDEILSSS